MIILSEQKKKCNDVISVLCNKVEKRKQSGGSLLDVLIATILSQNTNDVLSLKAYENLKSSYPEWDELLKVPVSKIERLIKIGGLAKQKSNVIKNLILYLKNKNGKVDLNYLLEMDDDRIFEELVTIKGIGKKTISCLLLFGMHRHSFPVDTHIHRICNRLGIVKTKNADETYSEMCFLVPRGKEYSLHVELIRFGREVCKARNPECYNCKLIDLCEMEDKNWKKPSKEKTGRKESIFILNKI
jgi:endonuclease III